ncbi:hemocyanin F chain-like [Penaeus monodon]|uniref:hemocyanin F chain-like n=1 Tax=Penaeus monodon TaxID=6687 RepID=UPI0018A71C63|nr:hemocyanin F chain-like [Penaeus monodon]
MKWSILMILVSLTSGVFGENDYVASQFRNGPEDLIKRVFYLPYETTTTLASRYDIIVPPLVQDIETGLWTTEIYSELKEKLGTALAIPRDIPYFAFKGEHALAVKDLSKVFLEATDIPELFSYAIQIRDHVNHPIYLAALYHAFYERKDLNPGDLPPLETLLPDRFVPAVVINKAKQLAKSAILHNEKKEIIVYWHNDETGIATRSPEQRLAYWREDIRLNSFHWHWHLSNPYSIEPGKRDRRGELFYYMHHNLVARYNIERLCVNLRPVVPFEDWHVPVKDGYFPHITTGNGYDWADRQDNTYFRDVREIPLDQSNFVSQLEMWRTHLYHAIDVGYMVKENGSQVRLTDNPRIDEDYGINLLGEAVEAGASVNPSLYGNLHNLGHDLLSQSHDPAKRHNTQMGIMGAVETAIRDPVFFRWHKFIENVFLRYKMTQPPYTSRQLAGNMEIVDVSLMEEEIKENYVPTPDHLHTFFAPSIFDSSRGIDFKMKPDDNVTVLIKTDVLDHPGFFYTIKILNPTSEAKRSKIRIFLAPKFDEDGQRLNFASLTHYWTEMDVFETDEIMPGIDNIYRYSNESSILSTYHGSDTDTSFAFSGCSWPRNLQLPRGTADGMAFHLFVMVSDVPHKDHSGRHHLTRNRKKNPYHSETPEPQFQGTSGSFCGRPNEKYPDPWPMGYPLDRKSSHETIESFVAEHPNMMLKDIVIKYVGDRDSVGRQPQRERSDCLLFTC